MRLKVLKMQYIGYTIDELLINHLYKIRVIRWISSQPFEQPGPGCCSDIRMYYWRVGLSLNIVMNLSIFI